MKYYIQAFLKYAEFEGRSNKSEYWFFVLFNVLFAIIAFILDNVLGITFSSRGGFGPLYIMYVLVAFIPGIAVAVRRLHDVGKSGSMIFVGLIPLVGSVWLLYLFLSDSVYSPNEIEQIGNETKHEHSSNTGIVDNKALDRNIAIVIIWMLISSVIWKVLPMSSDGFYDSTTFKIFNNVSRLLWAIIPLLLAGSVKNPSKKNIALVLAVLLLIHGLYNIATDLLGTNLLDLF